MSEQVVGDLFADGWLTPKEAAEHAKVCVQTMRTRIWEGVIPSRKFGNTRCVRKEDVDAWRESKQDPARRRIAGELVADIDKGELSIPQLAKLVSASIGREHVRQKVYWAAKEGVLPVIRKGKRIVVNADEAKKYLSIQVENEKRKRMVKLKVDIASSRSGVL